MRAAIVSALAIAVLSSCAASPVAKPQSTSSPQPASPTAEPPAKVAAIVVAPTMLELADAEGRVLKRLSYDLDAVEFTDELVAAIGSAPEVVEWPGQCCHDPRTTYYRWPGFIVGDDHPGHFADDLTTWVDEDGPDVRAMNLAVYVKSASVGELEIRTPSGFRIGDDLDALAAEYGVAYDPAGEWAEIPLEHGAELGPSEVPGELNAYFVVVTRGGETIQLKAPEQLGVGRT
ncbi:hypothetical protein [Ruicaihuangia caeni]|uniref:Uncharacterized protein n=1 Tax=Ruicaihuangia caeni TaxID=3042517 RepID=A0AAW6T133_9MICO|nr:hypothetical protein [Klugiella sp. YN-L-19]MDI2097507.1 hypothetical protein [Klugiella sp. YN-L-19]